MEKETLGTYLSSHPLAEVGPALRQRGRLQPRAARPASPMAPGSTVGGIVVDCKKIRTKSGSQMMFATLDDVEGQVEMLVFKADQAESARGDPTDAIVVVRGRLDHKDRGETKLVVQEAAALRTRQRGDRQRGQAGAGDQRRALRADGRDLVDLNPELVAELKAVCEHHKGDADVHLVVKTSEGPKKLR